MPDVSLNGIEFEINGGTEKASASIDDLVAKLDKLSTALESVVNKSGLTGAGNKAKKEIEPLSEALQDLIRNADKVEVLRGKLGGLRDSLEDAFKAGNEKRAWGIQGQILSTDAALEKATASAVPLSEEMQNAIANASQIDILEAKLESLRAAMQRAFDAGDQEGAYKFREQILRTEASLEKARDAANKTASALKDVGNAAKKANKPLGNFLNSLKRIAMYRILRSIIKSITQAFQEGLKNAYQFSKATGDQSGLAASLDKIASSSLQMKNQLGAAFGQLLVALTPVIVGIIKLVTALASAITRLIAILGGSSQWLKAKDVWTEWGDAAEGAGGAAKEALKYLAPFDELNVLPSQRSGGGGGGGDNYGDMFEWVDTDVGSGFLDSITEAFSKLADWFEGKDWQDIGYKAWDKLSEIFQDGSKANECVNAFMESIGAAFGAISATAFGFLRGFVEDLVIQFKKNLEDYDGDGIDFFDVMSAIFKTGNDIERWVSDNLLTPFITGFVEAFTGEQLTDDMENALSDMISSLWDTSMFLIFKRPLNEENMQALKDVAKELLDGIQAGIDTGVTVLSAPVKLAKDGWDTVSGWIEEGGWGYALQKSIGVAKDGWETISKWIEGTWMGDKIYKGIGVIRKGWEYISNWISDNFMGKSTPQKGIGIVRKGWDFISNWIKNNWMGQSTPNKGIGIARKGWDFVSNWIKENWMGASTPNKGIGIVRKGWDFVSNWIKEKWMGQSTPQKGIGVMREGWSTIAGWIGGSFMGNALNKGIGLLRDGWTKVSNWIGGNYMGDKLNQSIGLLRSGWTKISEWIKENSFIGDAIDVWVNLKQNGWNTVKQWIENLLGIGSLNLAVTSTVSQVGGNSIPSANGVMSSATHPLYSGGFVAIASNGGADGSMTEDLLYRAFSRALADSDLGGDIELDGNTLYKAMVNRNRANTRLTGVNAMA